MKLDDKEKKRIKDSYSGGSWDKVFSTIEDILVTHIKKSVDLRETIKEAIRLEETGGEQKRYWASIENRAYEVFLTLPEKVKAGRHLAEFKEAVRDKVSMGESAYKKKYEAFVKRYKEENTPEAKALKELDNKIIQLANEIEPPLG